jgi:thioredoxin reductase (NADPH)
MNMTFIQISLFLVFLLQLDKRQYTDIFVDQVNLYDDGYIMTNGTRTSVAGVFAAGDICDASYIQAITSASSGARAALDMERWVSTQ